MDKLSSKKEGKKEIRSKRLLTEAFFELLNECPGKAISVSELCDKAGYARQTFYAHFEQIQDVPYYYYKTNWIDQYTEEFTKLNNKGLPAKEVIQISIRSHIDYWITQMESYKLLKSIDMNDVIFRLYKDATIAQFECLHPTPDIYVNSIAGKCLINAQAQIAMSVLDIWAYSGREVNKEEMASVFYNILNGTLGLNDSYCFSNELK